VGTTFLIAFGAESAFILFYQLRKSLIVIFFFHVFPKLFNHEFVLAGPLSFPQANQKAQINT
jgi:hypothetical protein